MNFHALKVVSVERIAEDAVCLTMAVPESIRREFTHQAGQYVSVRRSIDGRQELRTYSIVSAPGCAEIRLGVREQAGGRMSRELATQLRPGDTLEVGPPLGRFRTSVDPARARSYVAFASGSGITPVLSLAEDILTRESGSRFTLLYGNRSTARTMFLEDTLALKNRHLGRFSVHFVMSREPQHTALLNGRIDAAKVEALSQEIAGVAAADEYFVCGPGEMVEEVREVLKRINPQAPVRIERFAAAGGQAARPVNGGAESRGPSDAASKGHPVGGPGGGSTDGAARRAADGALRGAAAADAEAGELLAMVSVTMDGRRRTFPMAAHDASVLDAAERAGLELPFSCRAGICATCRTRVKSGHVEMTHNIALERWELEAGFVLCCQARPTTPTLEISYDEK
jgi:ring-1,2-phenylacetyl-CoA epoxidase subunit PaaE